MFGRRASLIDAIGGSDRFLRRGLLLPGGLALGHARRDHGLVALVVRDVVASTLQLVGQVLLRDVVALVVVREDVAHADPVGLHPPVPGRAQVVRNRQDPSRRTSARAAE